LPHNFSGQSELSAELGRSVVVGDEKAKSRANPFANEISQPRRTRMQGRAVARDNRIGQSVCGVCNKTVYPGSGIVLESGAGGRVCKQCIGNQHGDKHNINIVSLEITEEMQNYDTEK